MKRKNIIATGCLLSAFAIAPQVLYSQTKTEFSLDGNMKSRFEYRHGYAELMEKDEDPAAFINQRVRIEGNYVKDWLKIKVSAQQIYTWGENQQQGPTDKVSQISIAEAWVDMNLNDNWSLKLGRQSLLYDDERILGALDWTQTGSFHDLALLKYHKNNWKNDIGFTYNQQAPSNKGTLYKIGIDKASSYKVMSFLHSEIETNGAKLSYLYLLNGFQKQEMVNGEEKFIEGLFYKHTTGAYFNIPFNQFGIEGSAYYQFGNADKDTKLSAYQLRLEPGYHTENLDLSVGVELLSGNDANTSDSTNHSFIPLYGTNHYFNGYMDYFYVGNYTKSYGLKDFYSVLKFRPNTASELMIKPHIFYSYGNTGNAKGNYLGTEIDVKYDYNFKNNVKLGAGYSHIFPTASLGEIKNGSTDQTNNWFYVQLIFTPRLFSL